MLGFACLVNNGRVSGLFLRPRFFGFGIEWVEYNKLMLEATIYLHKFEVILEEFANEAFSSVGLQLPES